MAEIKVEGLDSLIERLEAITDEETAKQIITKASLMVERAAKQKAPKGIGELRRSITSKVETTADGVQGTIFTPLLYAPYVEFGTGLFAEEGGRTDVPWRYKDDEGNWHTTSGQPPKPFMRPALEENREEIKRLIKEGILKE